eukprot:108160-Pleurochrysis_carterae.AAC.6
MWKKVRRGEPGIGLGANEMRWQVPGAARSRPGDETPVHATTVHKHTHAKRFCIAASMQRCGRTA